MRSVSEEDRKHKINAIGIEWRAMVKIMFGCANREASLKFHGLLLRMESQNEKKSFFELSKLLMRANLDESIEESGRLL